VQDVLSTTLGLAARAVSAGGARERILIDPAHDFGKKTGHSLEVTRRLGGLVATGWPGLVSLSNKDFVGEALGLPGDERGGGAPGGGRAGGRDGGGDGGQRVARGARLPGPRSTRDAAGAGHGFGDPGRDAAGPGGPGARLIVAAALCASPPLLHPALTGRAVV